MWKMMLELIWQNQGGREGKGEEEKEGSPVQNNLHFQPITLHEVSIFIDSFNRFHKNFFISLSECAFNSHAVFR